MKMQKIDQNMIKELAKEVSKDLKQAEGFVWKIDDLPSKMKLYPPETTITGRPLKTLEVKHLATLDETNYDDVINDVLRRVINGITVEELTTADKLYLIFWLRANTYIDSGYKVTYNCHKCEKVNTKEVHLNEFEIKYLSDELDEEKQITLPKSKDKVSVRVIRVRDELRVANAIKQNKLVDFDRELLTIASVITVNSKKFNTIFEAYDYMISLEAPDYAYLNSYIETFYNFGIIPQVTHNCASCKEVNYVPVTFRPDFFIPVYTFN